jgi:outer membrane immunogenic protein
MPVKAPPSPPPAPVYNWTGWYVGGNVGGSRGDAKTDFAGNGSVSFASTSSSVFGASNTAHPNGVIGGGQIGYNYQFSPNWVLGFEADIQASGERGSGQFVVPFLIPGVAFGGGPGQVGPPFFGAASTSYGTKIDWFGTFRGRLGFLVGDQLLIYGTGGLAYGEVAVCDYCGVSFHAHYRRVRCVEG